MHQYVPCVEIAVAEHRSALGRSEVRAKDRRGGETKPVESLARHAAPAGGIRTGHRVDGQRHRRWQVVKRSQEASDVASNLLK
jgi:hypothetical protein